MKQVIAAISGLAIGSALLAAYFLTPAGGVGGGTGTISQLQQWKYSGTYLTQMVADQALKFTGLESSGDCLKTDATGVVTVSACGGGGSSKWTDAGTYIYPNAGDYISGPRLVATSTTASSTFAAGVQIDGNTRLKTTLTGIVQSVSGLLSATTTGALSESVTGLELSASRALIGGSAALSLTSGYNIPLTASTTEWNTFYITPSNRITAGTGIDWSGNTLNGVYTAGDAITLTGEDFDFDGGATPAGDLGGTWASPSVTDDSHAHTGATISGIDISSDTNLAGDSEIVLTGDTLSIAASIARDAELHSAVTVSGALDYITLVGQDIVRGSIDLATDVTGALGIANGGLGAAFTDPNADRLMFYDYSAGFITGIATLTGLSISGTTLTVNDVTCTDCLTSTEIADEYLFNTGDVATGNWDFGGASFFEIPNGTAPTADDPGEIAHDTTDNQLILDDRIIRTEEVIFKTTIASTSVAFISSGLLPIATDKDGYTLTRIECRVVSGTSKVIAIEDESGNSSEDITCGTTVTADDGSITNATYTASEESLIDFGATSGAVDYVTVTGFGTITRE